MKLIKSWIALSEDDTRKIAAELANELTTGDVVLLEGTLGAGKTFLVQEICKQWCVADEVTSPTFTIIQNYSGDVAVNHMDLYRIERIEELDQLGWEEMVYSDAVTFIEWPEKVEPVLQSYCKISIEQTNQNRHFKFYKKSH